MQRNKFVGLLIIFVLLTVNQACAQETIRKDGADICWAGGDTSFDGRHCTNGIVLSPGWLSPGKAGYCFTESEFGGCSDIEPLYIRIYYYNDAVMPWVDHTYVRAYNYSRRD